MRIIGGTKRGKKLAELTGEQTRPTADRARESLFNLLNNHLCKQDKTWDEITFVDVFAGTGAVGVEAASRGAKYIFFFENNPLAIKCLLANAKELKNTTFYKDATKPPLTKQPADIIFMDPPYAMGLWEQALPLFLKNGWIDKNTLVVIETDKIEKSPIPTHFDELDRRSYGRNTFIFLKLTGEH